ncbi:MAG: restriction endonuclease subunit S [Campylobacterota bacterium]|nr:restriction endonuclease subunit S [Campylobacterota bacterium]
MSCNLPNGWEELELSEFINFNPKETIKKGTVCKSIPMACLMEFCKNISEYEEKEFKGGTKFRNGDTLFARITPCLENGKTAFVDFLDEDEVAFGSTEYIVLREKEKVSDKDFIYYLSISPQFREIAIKSMTGSSGRQRVQNDVLFRENFILPLDINEQKRIADILSAFDDKIELNNQMNQTLEEMATALFKEWFENFNFPNSDGKAYKDNGGEMKASELGEIPIDWGLNSLDKLSQTISKGTTPRKKDVEGLKNSIGFLKVKDISDSGIINIGSLEKIPKEVHEKQLKRSILKVDDILISIAGTIGRVSIVPNELENSNCNQAIAFIRLKDKEKYKKYIYQWIRTSTIQNQIESSIVQGVQANVSLTTLSNLQVIIPDDITMDRFNDTFSPIFEQIQQNQQQNQTLKKQRDTLLPKLLSGEIRV